MRLSNDFMGRIMGSLKIRFLNISNLELLVVRNFLKTWSLKSNYERGNGKIGREGGNKLKESRVFRPVAKNIQLIEIYSNIFISPFFFYFLWKEQHGCQSVLSINLSIDTPVCLSTAMVQWNYVEKHCGEAFNNWRHQYRTTNSVLNIWPLTLKITSRHKCKHTHTSFSRYDCLATACAILFFQSACFASDCKIRGPYIPGVRHMRACELSSFGKYVGYTQNKF